MAKRERIESAGESPPAPPTTSETKPENELPLFEAPPLSPAVEAPAVEVAPPAIEITAIPEPPRFRFKIPELPRFRFKMPELPRFSVPRLSLPRLALPRVDLPRVNVKLTRRRKRYALLAATVMLAAGLGAVIGAAASGGFAGPPKVVAGLHEDEAMQQTIARLTDDIKALKASVVAANKTGHSQMAKISAKTGDKVVAKPAVKAVEKINGKAAEPPAQTTGPEITGSIPPPLPAPRPALAESASRPPLVKNWRIRDVRDGYVYVQGHGDIYEVVRGAPLPGLGPVKSIKQQDGHWVVATPKGIIVSRRDRHFFE